MFTAAKDYEKLLDELGPELSARAALHDQSESFVAESYATLRTHGFFKLAVPSELGGPGLSMGELCSIIQRLGSYCGSSALAFSMHSHLVATAAYRWRHMKGAYRRLVAARRQREPGAVLERRLGLAGE